MIPLGDKTYHDMTLPAIGDRSAFGNHAFVRSQKDQKIFDSCAGPALGTDSVDKYYQDYHDDSTSLEDEKDTDSLSSSLETWTIKVIK